MLAWSASSELNTQVVQNKWIVPSSFVFLTPASVHAALRLSALHSPSLYAMKLSHDPSIATIEQGLVAHVPRGSTYEFLVTSRVTAGVEAAIKPESIALGAFGAIVALVCLALAAQTIARQLRSGDEDREVRRSIGAHPRRSPMASSAR